MSSRILNMCQTQWNMLLSQFQFVITYRPKKQQGLFDPLSRRLYVVPKVRERQLLINNVLFY